MTPEKGWHGYWENPGDAGKPMTVEWQLPQGATTGPLRYPIPTRLVVADLMNHPTSLRSGATSPVEDDAETPLAAPRAGVLGQPVDMPHGRLDRAVGPGQPANRLVVLGALRRLDAAIASP